MKIIDNFNRMPTFVFQIMLFSIASNSYFVALSKKSPASPICQKETKVNKPPTVDIILPAIIISTSGGSLIAPIVVSIDPTTVKEKPKRYKF